jgi:hypothetical protein
LPLGSSWLAHKDEGRPFTVIKGLLALDYAIEVSYPLANEGRFPAAKWENITPYLKTEIPDWMLARTVYNDLEALEKIEMHPGRPVLFFVDVPKLDHGGHVVLFQNGDVKPLTPALLKALQSEMTPQSSAQVARLLTDPRV